MSTCENRRRITSTFHNELSVTRKYNYKNCINRNSGVQHCSGLCRVLRFGFISDNETSTSFARLRASQQHPIIRSMHLSSCTVRCSSALFPSAFAADASALPVSSTRSSGAVMAAICKRWWRARGQGGADTADWPGTRGGAGTKAKTHHNDQPQVLLAASSPPCTVQESPRRTETSSTVREGGVS